MSIPSNASATQAQPTDTLTNSIHRLQLSSQSERSSLFEKIGQKLGNLKPLLSNILNYFDLKDTSNSNPSSLQNIETKNISSDEISAFKAFYNQNGYEYGVSTSVQFQFDEVDQNQSNEQNHTSLLHRSDDEIALHLMLEKASNLAANISSPENSAPKTDAVPLEEPRQQPIPSGLDSLHQQLLDAGYSLQYCSGEGNHCGTRSIGMALINHFRHLQPQDKQGFLNGLEGYLDHQSDKEDLATLLTSAQESIEAALQKVAPNGDPNQVIRTRIRMPDEATTFSESQNDHATNGEKLLARLISNAATQLDNNRASIEANPELDIKLSIQDPNSQMFAESITKILTCLGVNSSVLTHSDGAEWSEQDNVLNQSQREATEFNERKQNYIEQSKTIIARLRHAHFIAYTK